MAHDMETTLRELIGRTDNLEMKSAFQDDVIEELNKTIVMQSTKIEQLQAQLNGLKKFLREAQDNTGRDPQDEVPPPHY
jgi:SlyX protein